jgi:hypothetical protein
VKRKRRSADREKARHRPNRPGFRLGIGAGSSIAKLVAAACLTVLLVLAIERRWSVFVLIGIGILWAIVFAGLIVVPIIASFIADSLSQYGLGRPHTPPDKGFETDSWAQVSTPPTYPPHPELGSFEQATNGRRPGPRVGMAAGFDWEGLVDGVAERLETALGEGFSADSDGAALVLRHGEVIRRVNLRSLFQPPPLEVGDRALRGCLKMMDEAQMFSMRVRQAPWPTREGALEGAAGNLARPRVRLDDGEIRMVWADNWGTVLRLQPIPFKGSSPATQSAGW